MSSDHQTVTAEKTSINGHDSVPHQQPTVNPLHPTYTHDYDVSQLAQFGRGLAPAHGGYFQPGLFKAQEHRKLGNPAPLGLCAFALTTFVLSAVNMEARGVKVPEVVVPLAFGYGGLVQLLAGMW